MKNDTIYVWSVDLDGSGAHLAAFDSYLSQDERERANRFRFQKDRDRWVVARGALRLILSDLCQTAPAAIGFRYGRKGKPQLASPSITLDLNFNLSHSGALALIAVATGQPVGIDVERVRRLSDLEDIAKSHFSQGEQNALLRLQKSLRMQSFFRCWTAKEAFIKLLGDGLSVPLDGFEVSLAPDSPLRLLSADGVDGEPGDCHFFELDVPDDYVATLAVDTHQSQLLQRRLLVEQPRI